MVCLLPAGVAACSSSVTLYKPTADNIRCDPAELPALVQGRKLYVTTCSNCHLLLSTDDYNEAGWTVILERMQARALITDQQKALILKYLTCKKIPAENP